MERIGTQQVVFMGLEHEVGRDQMRDMLVHQMSGYVLGGAPRKVSISISQPASWFQHLKMDWLGWVRGWSTKAADRGWVWVARFLWWIGKYESTVRTNTRKVNRNICPHAPLGEVQDRRPHLEFLMRSDRGFAGENSDP